MVAGFNGFSRAGFYSLLSVTLQLVVMLKLDRQLFRWIARTYCTAQQNKHSLPQVKPSACFPFTRTCALSHMTNSESSSIEPFQIPRPQARNLKKKKQKKRSNHFSWQECDPVYCLCILRNKGCHRLIIANRKNSKEDKGFRDEVIKAGNRWRAEER